MRSAEGSAVRRRSAQRRAVGAALDAVSWLVAIVLWLLLRYEGWGGFQPPGAKARVVLALIVAISASTGVGLFLATRRGRPPIGSFEDAWRLTVCNVSAGIVLLVVDVLFSPRLIPLSTCVSATAGATLLSMGWRGAVRARWWRDRSRSSSSVRAIVFGAGDGGRQIIDAFLTDSASDCRPVAILDDDPAKGNLVVRGVRVCGDRTSMASVARRFGATELIIAIPSANSATIRELAALGVDAGLDVRVLPTVSELLVGRIGSDDVRAVSLTDLLGRATVETDLGAAAELVAGRRVLVTGAGGSIGSEIARQVHALGPAVLTLLDRDESALHALQLELEGRALLDSRHLVVADIRDRRRIGEVFDEHRPDLVFHAAALKHLPLLEMHPSEAVKSNVFGTLNVLECAGAVGVSHFVNISTDKAANPTSALGSSKRLAEGLTSGAARRFGGRYLSVRFGNVLGSRGTAIDAFTAQIAAGGPVTVTDPEVTRFFMTITEAVHLVLQAAAFGEDGEVMVLDMGEPVRIADIVTQMIAQSPDPIEIVFTGLRPGEKLHEELFNDGEIGVRAVHPLIFHVAVPAIDESIVRVLHGIADREAAAAMTALVSRCMGSDPVIARDRTLTTQT